MRRPRDGRRGRGGGFGRRVEGRRAEGGGRCAVLRSKLVERLNREKMEERGGGESGGCARRECVGCEWRGGKGLASRGRC